ncbi:MAG: tetratricopeptide repeat protein [Desulfobacterales bacterium]|nr:tetratricopeptide repeat protein [Desulfobacterales bacterium]
MEFSKSFISKQLEMAASLHISGELDKAELIYKKIINFDANSKEAFHLLGLLMYQKSEYIVSENLIRNAISLDSNVPAFYSDLGNSLKMQGRQIEAIECYKKALKLDQNCLEGHYNYANELMALNKSDEAISHYKLAIAQNPNIPEIHYNLGIAFAKKEQYYEASQSYKNAINLKPDYYDAYFNLAHIADSMGELDEAIKFYKKAIDAKPYAPEAHFDMSLTLLRLGDYKNGWNEYEWRLLKKDKIKTFTNKILWRGEPLLGKKLLIQHEQGIGDSIQFIRYAELAKNRGGYIIFETKPSLFRLFKNVKGIDELVECGNHNIDFDFYIPILNLPKAFLTTWETVPAEVPYIYPEEKLVNQWLQKFQSIKGFKIGICWQGNPKNTSDSKRSVPLKYFNSLFGIENTNFISLQKQYGNDQLSYFKAEKALIDFSNELDENTGAFIDTAAVMKNLDLVITVDTAIAHLAGAIGVPVFLVLTHPPTEWRWGYDADVVPWYPTMFVFRQKQSGDWGELFYRIKESLKIFKWFKNIYLPQSSKEIF